MRRLIPFFMCLAAVALTSVAAPAQRLSNSELTERLERFERDLMDLQRLVYRGQAPEGQAPAVAMDSTTRAQAAQMEIRLGSLSTEMQRLTGLVEELQFQIRQVSDRLDKFSEDVEFRLNQIERNGSTAAASGAPTETPVSAPPTGEPANVAALSTGTPQELYDRAFGYLRQGAYGEAEDVFKSFLSTHPQHQLAANAQYWLGETFYVRKQYDAAAEAFLSGYQDYPDSNKRPDSLLKLGMSLHGLGQTGQACSVFAELRSQFPNAAPQIQEKLNSAEAEFGC